MSSPFPGTVLPSPGSGAVLQRERASAGARGPWGLEGVQVGGDTRTAAPRGFQPPTPAKPCQQATHTQDRLPAPHVPHTQCAAPLAPPIECVHTAGSVSSTHTPLPAVFPRRKGRTQQVIYI